jgi:uncharacterized protein YbjT (DUF2867 family)
VFFSVIHPQIEALPAHRQKLLVEQYLIDSELPYTILQAAHFMQVTNVPAAVANGFLPVPFSIDVPMSYVDLRDIGEAATKVLSEQGHLRTTYEVRGSGLYELPKGRRVDQSRIWKVGRSPAKPDIHRDRTSSSRAT